MNEFVPGQRWISETELQMGLGTVLTVDHRTVTILFLATGETRVYSQQSAPLTRVRFNIGDEVSIHEGAKLSITDIREQDGIIHYTGLKQDGSETIIDEGQLDNFIQLNKPFERLLTRQIDQNKWFELRYETLLHKNRLSHSDLRGLTGVRTSLIPHQLYIAHEVAQRYAPRVLLADEVGLGKTIEAGLIIHQQLITERAKRILIIVPDTLVHQWLVEMLRRFNLYFSVFDEQRCTAYEEPDSEDTEVDKSPTQNPFLTEQLVLCSLDLFLDKPERLQQAMDGEWDLLVVDEAHHLQWSPEQASPEYLVVEHLAARTQGILLLTATPEQLGKESHFARLRLLDPDRFPDFKQFIEEEKHYEPVAQAVEELMKDQPLSPTSNDVLQSTFVEGDNRELLQIIQTGKTGDSEYEQAKLHLVEHLLDRHGTGRVLFRNTRTTVKGFPGRQVHLYELPMPEAYRNSLQLLGGNQLQNPQLLLCPEILYQVSDESQAQPWTELDPRIGWLMGKLKELKPAKVLVITASADTALDLEHILRTKAGIHAAVFHEGLSIVERDRAAAYFADMESGSQVLVCSEIGSEGRNFQFAHHLVLFDLPINPDLLEQRIGRLDRIGQTDTIQIHVPHLDNSAQALMAHWYHNGLSAFEHTCPAGHNVFVQLEEKLVSALHSTQQDTQAHNVLIEETANLHKQLNEELHKGRDILLEYNSCRNHIASAIQEKAIQLDEESALPDYLESVFDCFDIDSEIHTRQSLIIQPGNHMQQAFPGLNEEGMTITYDRDIALSFEDMHFITWDHPLVTGAMEIILSQENGNTAVTAIKHSAIKPGMLFVECVYVLEPASTLEIQTSRYLPSTSIRVVSDQQGKDFSKSIGHKLVNTSGIHVDNETAKKVIRSQDDILRSMLKQNEQIAQSRAPAILNEAHKQIRETLETEINRLKALKEVNPNVREEEIQFFENVWHQLDTILDNTQVRLDAIRVIVST
ncbi:MAG: RNA polymerase-associated protein RapA [Gammaproteobacteria bacterium]|nr:RNA polymerase-associated protein RapA [Gammaproteobacteria bacterium]